MISIVTHIVTNGLLALFSLFFAIKPYYGGEMAIRLNEPADFAYSPSGYSNVVFYSLLYENLFYLQQNGDIETHLFESHQYDRSTRTLTLVLKEDLRFSDGQPVSAAHIKVSLKLFLDRDPASSRNLRRVIKTIETGPNRVVIELTRDEPGIVAELTAPGLVLTGTDGGAFSGPFFPGEWTKGRHMILKANPYYPGGRSYLDSVRVVFYDYYYPDVFLAAPGSGDGKFNELSAGVYQNTYLTFPGGKVGNNTRLALYSLLRDFYLDGESGEEKPTDRRTALNSLTSDGESPITLDIKKFSPRRVRSILRYSRLKLYVPSSLGAIETPLTEFLEKRRLSMETIFVGDNDLTGFLSNTPVKYLLLTKTFNRRMPIAEKIKLILKETSFGRFDETYLKWLNQLDEVKHLDDEEMLLDLVSKIIEQILSEGLLLPICQKRFSLYHKSHVTGIDMDYYGKPLFRRVRIHPPPEAGGGKE